MTARLHNLFATAVMSIGISTAAHAGIGSVSCEWLAGLKAQLEAAGLTTDAADASAAVTLSLVQQVDPKARLVSPEEKLAVQREREGLVLSPGLSFTMTNGLPAIAVMHPEAPIQNEDHVFVGDTIAGVGTQMFTKISLPEIQALTKPENEDPLILHVVHLGETNKVNAGRVMLQEASIERVELLPNNVGYIKLNGLYQGCGRDVVSRIRAWTETNREGIILDLRGAGGNDTYAVTEIASLFTQNGQFLFAFRDLHQQDLEVAKALDGDQVAIPLMVLIDRRTTGAAEVLAAVLNASSSQALLIGEPTEGNFTLREPAEISGHDILVTVKALDTADGVRYNGKFGIQPAVPVLGIHRDTHDYEPPVDLLDRREKLDVEERDLQIRRRVRGDGSLERAVDILTALKSLNKEDSRLSSPDSL